MAEKDIILETKKDVGEIKIANEVVLVIAAQALCDIKGIQLATSVAEGIVDKLVKKSSQRGVRIYLNEETKKADIDVHININYGVNIPEISWSVQEAVKKNVEIMTDLSIDKVNVFVDGVILEKEPKPPKAKKIKEPDVDKVSSDAEPSNEEK